MSYDSYTKQVLVEKNFKYYYKVGYRNECEERCNFNAEYNHMVGIGSINCQDCICNIESNSIQHYIICSMIHKAVKK